MPMSKLSDLAKAFKSDLEARACSPRTVTEYMFDVKVLTAYLGTDDTRLLTPQNLAGYVAWLGQRKTKRTKGDGPRTIGRRLAGGSSFCKWLVQRGDLRMNPFDTIQRPKKPKRLPRAIPVEWLDAILGLPDLTPLERAVMAVIRYCGLRVSEVANLAVEDVDTDGMVLVVRSGKGDKDRAIPLDLAAVEALKQYKEACPRLNGQMLFQAPRGGVLTKKGIGVVLNDLAKRAGVPHFTVHQVRHTFGTEAAKAGVGLPVLQAIMGHERPETTMLYIDVAAQDLKQGMAALAAWRKGRQ